MNELLFKGCGGTLVLVGCARFVFFTFILCETLADRIQVDKSYVIDLFKINYKPLLKVKDDGIQ